MLLYSMYSVRFHPYCAAVRLARCTAAKGFATKVLVADAIDWRRSDCAVVDAVEVWVPRGL